MFVEHDFFIGLKDVDFNNNIKIKSLLSFFEDIAGIHSNKVGFGMLDIPKTKRSWILTSWKVKILKKPIYSDTVHIKTWTCDMSKLYAHREFEVYNKGEKIAIATSRWLLIDIEKGKFIRIEPNVIDAYGVESGEVFDSDVEKLKEPESYIDNTSIKITRDLIDVNRHVHNLNYLDFASQILPYEIMQNATDFDIMYKKEIKEDDTIKCFYGIKDNYHYVVIKSEDEKVLHAIIRLK